MESLHISYKDSGKNIGKDWIGTNCIFCGDEGNHLGIHIKSKMISCWKCGQTGTILSFISRELGSFTKALALAKEHIPRELQLEKEKEQSNVTDVLLPVNAKPGLSKYHKIYLMKRGFNPEYLEEKYMLHHVGPVGRFRNRIIVPVLRNFQLISYTTIDINDDSKLRYQHLDEELSIIPVKKLLYGVEFTDGHNVVVVEGIFDFFRMGDGCVPLFGVKFTSEQVRQLAKFAYVKIVGDGDKQGWEFNKKLSAALHPFTNVRYFDLEEDIDPDKLTKEEIEHIKTR